MYILYGGGVTRSLGPQMVLEEGGLPYRLVRVDIARGEHRAPEYLRLNPAGYVPALVTPTGDVMHEAAAIMIYLADHHRLDALLPAADNALRATVYSKLFYHSNEIQPATKRFFYPHRYSSEPAHTAAIRCQARTTTLDRWQVLNDFLVVHGPYHLGQRFSLVDLHLTMWAAYGLDDVDDVLRQFGAIRRCYDLVCAREKIGPLVRDMRTSLKLWQQTTDANGSAAGVDRE